MPFSTVTFSNNANEKVRFTPHLIYVAFIMQPFHYYKHHSLIIFTLFTPFGIVNTFTSHTHKTCMLFNELNKMSYIIKKQRGLEESGTFQGFNSSRYTRGFSLQKEIVSTEEACVCHIINVCGTLLIFMFLLNNYLIFKSTFFLS